MYLGGYDGRIPEKYTPLFFAAVHDSKVVGVVSGHHSTDEFFRLRGLYVDDSMRGHGVSVHLINAVIEAAKQRNCKMLWATPRPVSLPIFEKLGFTKDSDFTHEGFAFGPNCYVSLKLI
jgi:GNAT superfamily N-acetyltransferase